MCNDGIIFIVCKDYSTEGEYYLITKLDYDETADVKVD